jgi:hypothetical protein
MDELSPLTPEEQSFLDDFSIEFRDKFVQFKLQPERLSGCMLRRETTDIVKFWGNITLFQIQLCQQWLQKNKTNPFHFH